MNFIRDIVGDLGPVFVLVIAGAFIAGSLGCGVMGYKHYRRQKRHRHSPRIGSRILGFAYVVGAAILVLIGLSLIMVNLG